MINSANSTNFKKFFLFPKWSKIFMIVLSVFAIVACLAVFGLNSWASGREFSANLTFHGFQTWKTQNLRQDNLQNPINLNDLANLNINSTKTPLFSYKARVHFESLAFLLRSRTIANIDIKDISWSEKVSKAEILSVKSENRYISFISTQSPEFFNALKGENLGVLSYQINFSLLFVTIFKYYGLIFVLLLLFLCSLSVANALQKLNSQGAFAKQGGGFAL